MTILREVEYFPSFRMRKTRNRRSARSSSMGASEFAPLGMLYRMAICAAAAVVASQPHPARQLGWVGLGWLQLN